MLGDSVKSLRKSRALEKGGQGGRKLEYLPWGSCRDWQAQCWALGGAVLHQPLGPHPGLGATPQAHPLWLFCLGQEVHHHGRKKKTGALQCRVSRQEEQGGAGISGLEGARRPGCATILWPVTSIWRKRTFYFLIGLQRGLRHPLKGDPSPQAS